MKTSYYGLKTCTPCNKATSEGISGLTEKYLCTKPARAHDREYVNKKPIPDNRHIRIFSRLARRRFVVDLAVQVPSGLTVFVRWKRTWISSVAKLS